MRLEMDEMSSAQPFKSQFLAKLTLIIILLGTTALLLYAPVCGGGEDTENGEEEVASDEDSTDACAFTNDGECDEPEGTGVCAEGTDTTDCAAAAADDDDDGDSCGEPCPDGCCSLSGAICCQPPFCSGNCIGSPCC